MIYLSIGSNLPSSFGDRFKNIELAISYLAKNKINLINQSSFYETLSFPDKTRPKFINIAVSVETSLSPKDLILVILPFFNFGSILFKNIACIKLFF